MTDEVFTFYRCKDLLTQIIEIMPTIRVFQYNCMNLFIYT